MCDTLMDIHVISQKEIKLKTDKDEKCHSFVLYITQCVKKQSFLCMLSKYCASYNIGKNGRQERIKYLFILLQ